MKNFLYETQQGSGSRTIFSVFVLLFFGVLIGIAIFNWKVSSKDYLADLISDELIKLTKVLERIDGDCKILSFDYQKNNINFLNVVKFIGSEVGSINLAHPDKWQGPYLDDNPTYLGKEYLVVRTKKGYFVTPPEGVKLPNGLIIGKDIMLDEDADISAMMDDEKILRLNDKPLAIPLNIDISGDASSLNLPMERI